MQCNQLIVRELMAKEKMKVEIICKEAIKPSSPTPSHRRTHKLSFLDQTPAPLPMPALLFYSPTPHINPSIKSQILKTSLSKILTHYYPFAGRVKDSYTVDCNDEGVTYVEAKVDSTISVVFEEPWMEGLLQLLPFDPLEKVPDNQPSPPLLAVRVNHFACGGMAICVCVRHVVADGSAFANFLRTWAALAKGIDVRFEGVVCDCTSLFPPQDLSSLSNSTVEDSLENASRVVSKRFVFYASKIAALRDEIKGLGLYRPTRLEAVASLVWSALIAGAAAAKQDEGGEDDEETLAIAVSAVNLRERLNPPFPQLSIGNIGLPATAKSSVSKTPSLSRLAQELHESISKIDDKYVREFYGGGKHLNAFKTTLAELEKSSKLGRVFTFSSCCRFPFYETDFGWGNPAWIATALRINMTAIFVDSSDGKGIEAWIALTKQEMTKFEQHPAILAYASCNPSIHVLPSTPPSKL